MALLVYVHDKTPKASLINVPSVSTTQQANSPWPDTNDEEPTNKKLRFPALKNSKVQLR